MLGFSFSNASSRDVFDEDVVDVVVKVAFRLVNIHRVHWVPIKTCNVFTHVFPGGFGIKKHFSMNNFASWHTNVESRSYKIVVSDLGQDGNVARGPV